MPGLAGIIAPNSKERNRKDLLEMILAMQHESFYSTGTYINEAAGLYVGWTCHKASYCDCMPITNESGDLLLFFYGENYADKQEFDRLRARGYALKSLDASFVLHLYEEKGYDFLRCLNGWFHGILLDLKKREVAVFNDRFGMQRLYYFEEGDSLLFASEAKAILKVRMELRTLDLRSIGEFLTCDCILQNRTLFSKLYTFPGASVWTFNNGKLQKKACYFEPQEWEGQSLLDSNVLYRNLEALLPRLMARYVQSNLSIAVSLTGGLDTRLIMAYLANGSFRIPCYTFGGMYRESLDVTLARAVADACGQRHEVLRLGKGFLSSFPRLSEQAVYLSDGCIGACAAYELYLNRLARQVANIRLTGNYGSEVFRLSRGFNAVPPNRKLIHPDFHKHVKDAMDTFAEVSKCHRLSFGLFRQAPWYGYGRLSVEQSQVIPRTPFMDNDLIALMYRAPESVPSRIILQRRLIEHGHGILGSIPTDRALRGQMGAISSRWAYLKSYFLYKADYLYKSGMPQWMEQMHYFLGPLQPEKHIIGCHRFTHFRIWFRNELAAHIKEIILDPRTAKRAYVNGAFLEEMVFRHIKGVRNYTSEIEKVLTMELIYRLFIEQ
jgi:asparagine synthase (glutamine-hydrolysing)